MKKLKIAIKWFLILVIFSTIIAQTTFIYYQNMKIKKLTKTYNQQNARIKQVENDVSENIINSDPSTEELEGRIEELESRIEILETK